MIIYGVHAVEEALSQAPALDVRGLWMERGAQLSKRMTQILAMAQALQLEPLLCERERLDALSERGAHQGVALQVAPWAAQTLEEIMARVGSRPRALILALDQIQDVGNFGAIVRSAAAFGVDAILTTKDRAAPVNAAAIKASAGQLWRVPVAQVTNLSRALDALKHQGFWAAAAQAQDPSEQSTPEHAPPQAPSPLWSVDLDRRLVVVLGSEHEGIRRMVRARCELTLAIPMARGVESLNVSAAAAVLMYEITRQWALSGNAARGSTG